jgi:hypothetical protein
MEIYLDNAEKSSGRFFFWKWSLWSIGGGGGVQWYFMGIEINPSLVSPLWLIFDIQRGKHEI